MPCFMARVDGDGGRAVFRFFDSGVVIVADRARSFALFFLDGSSIRDWRPSVCGCVCGSAGRMKMSQRRGIVGARHSNFPRKESSCSVCRCVIVVDNLVLGDFGYRQASIPARALFAAKLLLRAIGESQVLVEPRSLSVDDWLWRQSDLVLTMVDDAHLVASFR